MLMPRSNKKATKVLYSLIGTPAPLIKKRKNKDEVRIDSRVNAELRTRIK